MSHTLGVKLARFYFATRTYTNGHIIEFATMRMLFYLLNKLMFHLCLQGGPKKLAHFLLYTLTSSNVDRFSNLFHFQKQEKICNNIITKNPTTPQECRCITL